MRRKIFYTSTSTSNTLPMKIVKFLLGLVLLGVVLTIAFFLFIYLVIFAAGFLGYWWWKTRALRKAMRNASQNAQQNQDVDSGYIIEGEVIRNTGNGQTVLLNELSRVHADSDIVHTIDQKK